MNKIICPIDFSEASINALEFAWQIAIKNHSSLILHHVITESEFNKVLDSGAVSLTFKQQVESVELKLKKLVDTIHKESQGQGFLKCTYEVETGKFPDALIIKANETGADAVIMGTTGVTDISEAYIGSNTVKTLEKVNSTVICVPENASYRNFSKIVYATDFHEEDKLAIQEVVSFAVIFDARIFVLHVSNSDRLVDKIVYEDFVKNLKSFVPYEKIRFINKHYENNVDLGIEEYMQEESADLLVLFKKQRNFFESLFHKSVAKNLSYITDSPMMILKG